jgi:iron(III) transport system ATP-binding protein
LPEKQAVSLLVRVSFRAVLGKDSVVLWLLESVSIAGRQWSRLDDVTLEIHDGVTAVLGQSGAGKTSLLNLLVRYEVPTSGRVTYCGDASAEQLAVFWAPPHQGLWPHLTVREHLTTVAPGGTGAGLPDVDGLLERFDLIHLAMARPNSLSLGEGSRLNVARALFSGANVLVMDEPLSHVDSARLGKYWNAIREICSARGCSLVFSTHAPETVLREAGKVICLCDGRVSYEGSVDELYDRPRTRDLALLLGPCNWLTRSEVDNWLSPCSPALSVVNETMPASGTCLRPERIVVEQSPDSPLTVETTRFGGASAEIEIRDERTGRTQSFVYRPQGICRVQRGDRVLLRILLLLLIFAMGGCTGETVPTIAVKRESSWMVPSTGTRVPAPRGMTVTPADEYMVLDNVGRILVYDKNGDVQRQWWMPEYAVGKPEGICKLKDGRIAVADTHYHRVVLFNHDGEVAEMFGQYGSEPGDFVYPVKITQDPEENIYICEYGHNDRVQKFRPDGTFMLQFGGSGTEPGKFQRPCGIVWYDHRLYVVDAFNNRIQVFEENGDLVAILGEEDKMTGLYYPYDIAVDQRGDLFVVEYGAGRVSKFSRQGRLLGRYGTTGIGQAPAQFSTPWGMAIDRRGWLYVCDTGNRRIVELEL